MATLLDEAIDAHGGRRRWKSVQALRATMSLAGPFWDMRAVPAALRTNLTADVQIHQQLVSLSTWTFPKEIATHSADQVFYFDAAGLLRRLDYDVEVSGNGQAAHYVDDYVDVDGLKFPTRRWVFPRRADNTADRQAFTGSRGSLIDVTVGDIVLRAANP